MNLINLSLSILPHIIKVLINPFLTNVPFWFLKTFGFLMFSGGSKGGFLMFSEGSKGSVGKKRVKSGQEKREETSTLTVRGFI